MRGTGKSDDAEAMKETAEYELGAKQCAEVALFMYGQWKKAMQPPVFMVIPFEEWLQKVISTANKEIEEAE